MPQPGQIIPTYLHPHVETYINDNTVFTDTAAAPTIDGARSIFVFASPKGRDGVLLKKSSLNEFIEEYGAPDFSRFGQPNLMPYAFLNGGNAIAYCLRVMPSNATLATSVVVAKVKVDPGSGATPVKKLVVRYEVVNISGQYTADQLRASASALTVTDPDADGFVKYPLFAISATGRGKYGNAFRFRILNATQADKDNSYKNYRVELYELDGSLIRKEMYEGAINSGAVKSGTSLYLDDVINDVETGSQKIHITTFEDSFKSIFTLYKSQVNLTTTASYDTFDLLYGTDKDTGVTLTDVVYDTSAQTFVALDTVNAIPLASGSDGDFDQSVTSTTRNTALTNAYLAAFAGTLDRTILSKRRAPAEFIFDANYPAEVKTALISLITKRGDTFGYIDAGILNTTTELTNWATLVKNTGDRLFSREGQNYQTRDPLTGRVITVTTTYFIASNLASHFKNIGRQVPFVGQYATLSGHIKNSVRPIIDADDSDVKEVLYNLRVNYFEATAENVFVRATQATSQNIFSDLSEENNMHVLLEIKRYIEGITGKFIYNFAEAKDRAYFQQSTTPYFTDLAAAGKIRSGSIKFDMNAWEEQRSILHCYVAITFKTMAKREIIEIDINKRA